MRFIELHHAYDGSSVFINADRIVAITDATPKTFVNVERGGTLSVRESVEEVMGKIKRCSQRPERVRKERRW